MLLLEVVKYWPPPPEKMDNAALLAEVAAREERARTRCLRGAARQKQEADENKHARRNVTHGKYDSRVVAASRSRDNAPRNKEDERMTLRRSYV